MRAPDWAMNNIRTLEKKKYMWLDIIYWVIPEKILTPLMEGMVFLTLSPLPPKFPKLLEPLPPQDPPSIWISIKLLDTVILIYTQCRRIVLGSQIIFLSNKSQFFVNSVFVVKVKITLSHLLKQAYTFWQISSQLSEHLFFPRPGKIHSNICSKLTMYSNKRFSSLSIHEINDCERRNRRLSGILHNALYC